MINEYQGRKVYELLEDPGHWCQGMAFANERGYCKREDATRCCLLGAVDICYGELYVQICYQIETELLNRGYSNTISHFNDNNPHSAVLALCREMSI